MNRRKVASILMLLIFAIMGITGLLSYFTEYTRMLANVHTIFGFAFVLVSVIHIANNVKPLKSYFKSSLSLTLMVMVSSLVFATWTDVPVVRDIMNYGARSKAKIGVKSISREVSEIVMDLAKAGKLTLEVKRAEHFWHPQIAVWTEDSSGQFIETLYVTKATAKGIFAGGRTKDNFKSLDSESANNDGGYRRVNALPVWSHKRGKIYEDGQYAPTYENPLPDALSGATPLDNFNLNASVDYTESFVVKFEINVAFDDNEYYSEFDFPDNEVFHNGTGQLGQPSLVYSTIVDPSSDVSYSMMALEGHGHFTAENGEVYLDLSKLSTALEIIKYIVVGFNNVNT